jgi:hypothetical protein
MVSRKIGFSISCLRFGLEKKANAKVKMTLGVW